MIKSSVLPLRWVVKYTCCTNERESSNSLKEECGGKGFPKWKLKSPAIRKLVVLIE